jgi:soluble lytic murein transglycosylase-like protein
MTSGQNAARLRQARASALSARDSNTRTGMSQWEFEAEQKTQPERRTASVIVAQWEKENRPAWRKAADAVSALARRNSHALLLVAFAFVLGFSVASGPKSAAANLRLRERLYGAQNVLTAREGELELTRLELTRLNTIMDNSQRYHIPADLASKIYDIALAEGIEPKVAFSLVSIESDFTHTAVSPVGALGLTQVMPSTARFFQPHIVRDDLFNPETNLHIGFRFLKELIAKYNGNVDLALSAYNRGPATVDKVVGQSRNPANGYSDAVLRGATQ